MTGIPEWLRATVCRPDFDQMLMVSERSPGAFAVLHNGSEWNFRTGQFDWEPQPSNRSGEFVADTRRTLAECVSVVEGMRPES